METGAVGEVSLARQGAARKGVVRWGRGRGGSCRALMAAWGAAMHSTETYSQQNHLQRTTMPGPLAPPEAFGIIPQTSVLPALSTMLGTPWALRERLPKGKRGERGIRGEWGWELWSRAASSILT